MSADTLDRFRQDTTDAVLSKVGKFFAKAEKVAESLSGDPSKRKLIAGRISLEYAVLATAREKNVETNVAARALSATEISMQASMIKSAEKILARSYDMQPTILASIFAGKMADVPLLKGVSESPELSKILDDCKNLVNKIVQSDYAQRGRFTHGHGNNDKWLELGSDVSPSKERVQLAERIAFVQSSIDASVKSGFLSQKNADLLKERVQHRVFTPGPPESLKFSKEFKDYYASRGKTIKASLLEQVSTAMNSKEIIGLSKRLAEQFPGTAKDNNQFERDGR